MKNRMFKNVFVYVVSFLLFSQQVRAGGMVYTLGKMINDQKAAQQIGQIVGSTLLAAGAYEVITGKLDLGYTPTIPLGIGKIKWGYVLIAGGVVALTSSNENGDNAAANAGTQSEISAFHPNTNGSADVNGGGDKRVMSPEVQAQLDGLKKKGITVDFKTGDITTPEGTFNALSAVKSPEGMAAAGLNASDFSKLQAAAQKAAEQANTKLASAGKGAGTGSADGAQFGDSGIGGGGGSAAGGETAGSAGAWGVSAEARKLAGVNAGTGGLHLVSPSTSKIATESNTDCNFFCSTRGVFANHVRQGHLDPNLK